MKKIILILSLLTITTQIKASIDLSSVLSIVAATGVSSYVFYKEHQNDAQIRKYGPLSNDSGKYFARAYATAATALVVVQPFDQKVVPLVVGAAFLVVSVGVANVRQNAIAMQKYNN